MVALSRVSNPNASYSKSAAQASTARHVLFFVVLNRVTVLSVNEQKQPIYQETSGIRQVSSSTVVQLPG